MGVHLAIGSPEGVLCWGWLDSPSSLAIHLQKLDDSLADRQP